MQQAARGPQPGPPIHLVWPLPTLWFFPITHENPNPTVYAKKLNFSCGPARCRKLVIWPTDKMLHTVVLAYLVVLCFERRCPKPKCCSLEVERFGHSPKFWVSYTTDTERKLIVKWPQMGTPRTMAWKERIWMFFRGTWPAAMKNNPHLTGVRSETILSKRFKLFSSLNFNGVWGWSGKPAEAPPPLTNKQPMHRSVTGGCQSWKCEEEFSTWSHALTAFACSRMFIASCGQVSVLD